MGAANDEFDLDFTVHFANAAVQSEKLPPAIKDQPVAKKPAAAVKNQAPEKVVLDPEFRIGTSQFEADGFFVAEIGEHRGELTACRAAANDRH